MGAVVILLALIFAPFFFVVTCSGRGGLVRVQEQEHWTRFENGRAVCGVGQRGYWTNTRHVEGPFPFEQRDDGTWFDPKTGRECVVMSLKEMLEKYT